MNSSLVSVIIPYYNKKNTINRSVQSVIDQTYTNWELIIIDDKSTEGFEINPIWAKYKISYLENAENLGPGLSRQKGQDSTKGEFICFLDSDDYWLPTFLEESLRIHNLNPDLCATYAQSQMVDGSLRRRNSLDDAVDDIFYGIVSGVRPWATCALMWKREYLPKWKSIRTNEDALFELEAALKNPKIKKILKTLCVIDKGTGNNSIDLVGNILGNENRFEVLLKACDFLENSRTYKNSKTENALWLSLYEYWKKMLRQKNIILSIKGIIYLTRFYKWR